jgi:hypothetical protein
MSSLAKVGSVLILSAATCLGAGCAANADEPVNGDEVAQADPQTDVTALPGGDEANPDGAQLTQHDEGAPIDEQTGKAREHFWGGWGWGGWGRPWGWGGWGGWGGLGWGGLGWGWARPWWGGGWGWGGWGGGCGWGNCGGWW